MNGLVERAETEKQKLKKKDKGKRDILSLRTSIPPNIPLVVTLSLLDIHHRQPFILSIVPLSQHRRELDHPIRRATLDSRPARPRLLVSVPVEEMLVPVHAELQDFGCAAGSSV